MQRPIFPIEYDNPTNPLVLIIILLPFFFSAVMQCHCAYVIFLIKTITTSKVLKRSFFTVQEMNRSQNENKAGSFPW